MYTAANTPFFVPLHPYFLKMITQEILKDLSGRELALRRYL